MPMNKVFYEVELLQNILVSKATGGVEDEAEFKRLRGLVISNSSLEPLAPRFIHTCRNLNQFWQFIKNKYSTYAERRTYIWEAFQPMLDLLERGGLSPSDLEVTSAIDKFDSQYVQEAWSKALRRRSSDPEGAITIARTLLESVCKHILEEASVPFDESPDLNKLYKITSEQLKIAPSQHSEQVFKQILGGCTSVVEGLGALRNRLSDSHGRAKSGVKPAPRHAELAVNLAGALATYLLATWDARNDTST